MAMFAQNKKKNPIASILVLQFLFSPVLMDYRWSLQHDELCFLWRVGSSTWSVTFRVEMRGRTLAKFDKMISQDRLVGVEGDSVGLRGRQHLLSMKNRAAAEGKVREHVTPPWGKEGRRDGGAVLTWTRTRRCAASCCPVGSGAAFCICLGPLSRSRRAARRSASSWFHPWPGPTLNLMSER